jgi:hypothetical protein
MVKPEKHNITKKFTVKGFESEAKRARGINISTDFCTRVESVMSIKVKYLEKRYLCWQSRLS